MTLVVYLEEELGIEVNLSDELLQDISTIKVGDLIAVIISSQASESGCAAN